MIQIVRSTSSASSSSTEFSGPSPEELEELRTRFAKSHRVKLPELLDPSLQGEIATRVARADFGTDVAVMPSTAPKSFGMAALEAMASSRPAVASLSGGVGDLVQHDVTGMLVAPGDILALSRSMLRYAASAPDG